ncbi:discoidin domain-containing protein [Haliangium ochraceum]|uniref:Coagulation factor 5/8 type domain protein n=1 Tax=Haliangium ochraceum (strain DSM 14365 / JCM 11303 / SMP-2) TaxID=502025 RepID=D0LSQ5_HALO1|nr:discoidin domain-containing protein [Haliangium ochraceum]ACY17277.1 coagulation factor 5/8 type domain protein [Haliangium ochraceum DSM 14365]
MSTTNRNFELRTRAARWRLAGPSVLLLAVTGCMGNPSPDEESPIGADEPAMMPDQGSDIDPDMGAGDEVAAPELGEEPEAPAPMAEPGLLWEENFDGPEIDRDTWTYDVGVGVWNWGSNQELQYYTDRPQNSYIENGKLVIEARREAMEGYEFTSARLKSTGRVSFKHGWIEARIKMPDLQDGLWPAFWLLGNENTWPASGELDIVEMGYADAIAEGKVNNRVGATAHWDYEGNYAGYGETYDAPEDLTQDYHVYKLYWDSSVIRGYIDDIHYWTLDISGDSASLEEFKSHQFYIILNLAVGGMFPGIYDPAQITAPLPAKMYVDYVRLYGIEETELYVGADNEKDGAYGVYTENTPVEDQAQLGVDTNLYLWNNLVDVATAAFEGVDALGLRAAAGDWFGMGFSTSIKNMSNYSDGHLRFHAKTTSTHPFELGISSAGAGEGWVRFESGDDPYGLVRDGQWHEVAIPLNKFGNIDFHSINQLFMLVGDAPGAVMDLAFDNIYWTPSVARPSPANGNYGVYTETASVVDSFDLQSEGGLFVWENTLQAAPGAPFEGGESLAYQSTPGLAWFGMSFTPDVKHDLRAFASGYLHFALKTTSTTRFQIGMKSGNVDNLGQSWIAFENGNDPYGFARDGQWHEIEIPLSDFASVDLGEVSQLFELLGTDGAITNIEIDDIYFGGGGSGPTDPPDEDHSVNRALGQPTFASSVEGGVFVASGATDGDPGTRWSSEFADPQWIYVDLGERRSLARVVLSWEAAYGSAYQVQVSDDAAQWTTLAAVDGGDGGIDDIAISGAGRYVRVYGTQRATPYGYSLFEFEVY